MLKHRIGFVKRRDDIRNVFIAKFGLNREPCSNYGIRETVYASDYLTQHRSEWMCVKPTSESESNEDGVDPFRE